MKTGTELRNLFLDYFKSKDHEIVASSSLVPEKDPTILFTNAGMNQFKDLFLGLEKRSYTRATTAQKCLRISGKHNDLENVGTTRRHHTFFEMMGNFSFGDYFKADAIKFGWEFATKVVGLDKARLWVTIYEDDDEAGKLWKDLTDVSPDRILRMGAKDNFWAMGETGPCGPCSEIHYFRGDDVKNQSEAEFRKDDGSYLEFWNLVFMQFDRSADGTLTPLPKPSVDTGLGLERLVSIVQNTPANYDIDLLRPIITRTEELSGFKYGGQDYTPKKDPAYLRDVAMRVIADHSRAVAFLIAEGVIPGSEGRNYVLRRLIRRAVRHARNLKFSEPFLKESTAEVVKIFGDQYPELKEQAGMIAKVVDAEERKFYETIESGMQVLEKAVADTSSGKQFSGDTAFLLHDTYGFPLDLTQDALKAYDMTVDEPAYERAMASQKERSRGDRKAQKIEYTSVKIEAEPTVFLGYQELEAEGTLAQVLNQDDVVSLVFDRTPFYGESGGQVGDTGKVEIAGLVLDVVDTQKLQGKFFVHQVDIETSDLEKLTVGEKAKLKVDSGRRNEIRKAHSATHLVHLALRKCLGTHVKQAGSRVDDVSLRFDFSHFEPVNNSQLEEIQTLINQQIQSNYEVVTDVMNLEEAKSSGAMALFSEKYEDQVRVVKIGPDSKELCGGTHVTRSGDIGFCVIESESSIAAGVHRIECKVGMSALKSVQGLKDITGDLASQLKAETLALPEKVQRLQQRVKDLEKEIEKLKTEQATSASHDLLDQARLSPSGIKVIVEKVAEADVETLKTMVDRLRLKLGSGVVALASKHEGKGLIVAGVTSDLVKKVNAGMLVKEASSRAGGRGGGRPDFAQAGGLNPDQLTESLEALYQLVG